jgi:hypothetical protein
MMCNIQINVVFIAIIKADMAMSELAIIVVIITLRLMDM